jgi:hypothetical protein
MFENRGAKGDEIDDDNAPVFEEDDLDVVEGSGRACGARVGVTGRFFLERLSVAGKPQALR